MTVTNPTTNPLPIGYGTVVGLASGPVLPPNPSRGGLIFVNPNSSAVVAICPSVVAIQAQDGSGNWPQAVGVAAIGGAGSITLNPGDKFILDNIQCTGGWNGITNTLNGVLTVLEF
jgi:hypothetical protein